MSWGVSLCAQCHENGMKVGLKNAIELVDDLSEYFDFAINESCHQWDECDVSKHFVCTCFKAYNK